MDNKTDPKYYEKLAQVESGGNAGARNPNSSAQGLYQFTEGTWNDLVKQYDLPFSIDDRLDPDKSKVVVEKFTEDNRKFLETRLKREVTDGELYLAHFLGRSGAKNLLERTDADDNASISDIVSGRAIQSNPNVFLNEEGSPVSSFDMINWANDKMGVQNRKQSVNQDLIVDNANLTPEEQSEALVANDQVGLTPEFIQGLNFNQSIFPQFNDPIFDSPESQEETASGVFESDFADKNFQFTEDITAFKDGGFAGGDTGQNINFTEINGPSHEESKTGGIILGKNKKGGFNLVEGKEGLLESTNGDFKYVLTDSLTITPDIREKANLDPSLEGLTYAAAGKEINKQRLDRPFDKTTNGTANQQFNQLIYGNELANGGTMNKKNKDNKYILGGAAGAAAGVTPLGIGLSMAQPILDIGADLIGSIGQGNRNREAAMKEAQVENAGFNSSFKPGGSPESQEETGGKGLFGGFFKNLFGSIFGDGEGGDDGDGKFDPKSLLRFAPVAANTAKALFDKEKPEIERFDRLDNKFIPKLLDTESLGNEVRQAARGTQRAIQANAAGSASAARSGILGSQLARTKGISDAMVRGEDVNREQSVLGQQFDRQTDQVNLQQDTAERNANAQNRAAAYAQNQQRFSEIFQDLGEIGREDLLNEMLKSTTGFTQRGNVVARDGGLLTSIFNTTQNPEEDELKEIFRKNLSNGRS